MKLGVCAGIDQADTIKEAGFDFIECTVVSLKPEEDDQTFQEEMRKFEDSPIPVEACNVFLPGDLKVVGESVDDDRIHRYVEKALERVKKIGADTVVFGSGGARTIPEGFPRGQGEEQIETFLHIVADYADPLDVTIVIEPLNRKESNIINSVPEAARFVRKVNRKSIKALADFYHMDEENEPLENIVDCKNEVQHIHVADTGRKAPGTGQYPYSSFVNCVKRAGYDGRISIECKWDDLSQQAVQSRKYLQEQFNL